MLVETPIASLEYFVLSGGQMFGPLTREALSTGLRDGRFAASDFVQSGDQPLWQPLALVVNGDTVEMPTDALVPQWKAIRRLAWMRLRCNLREHTVKTGIIFLLAAAATLAVSRWPFVFWMPWLAVTAWAGIVLLSRRREIPGTLLLLGVLAIPLTSGYLTSRSLRLNMASLKQPEVASVPESAPRESQPSIAEPALPPPEAPATSVVEASAPSPVTAQSAAGNAGKPPETQVVAPAAGTAAPVKVALAPAPQVVPPWERPAAPWEKEKRPSPLVGPAPAPADTATADLVQSHIDAFVIIKGREASGSGFIARADGKTWLYSNIHVVADLDQPTFTRLDNVPVVPGAADAAAGPDVVRFLLAQPPAHPLEMMTDVDANVRIGDEVAVLGNSGGGGVVTSLKGVIQGIGPDRLEVSAEFIPGNSGSPIVHIKSGKVIGIATYLTRRMDEFAPKSPGTPPSATPSPRGTPARPSGEGAIVVRRFGYRIDTVARWEPVHWPSFHAEARQVQQVSNLTEDIVDFLRSMRSKAAPNFATETLRRPATIWLGKVRTKHMSENDRISATQLFLGQLRSMVRGDIQAGEARFRYSYFRNSLRDEQQAREQLYNAFNEESASLASPVGRPGYR